MMGWRMGYLAYDESNSDLAESLLKVQDTIPICPTQISQHMALGALREGAPWIAERVASLEANRRRALGALRPLGEGSVTRSTRRVGATEYETTVTYLLQHLYQI